MEGGLPNEEREACSPTFAGGGGSIGDITEGELSGAKKALEKRIGQRAVPLLL